MNQILLTMLGAVSAFELSMINERWAEGQAMAKADGKHMGRVAKPSDVQAPPAHPCRCWRKQDRPGKGIRD